MSILNGKEAVEAMDSNRALEETVLFEEEVDLLETGNGEQRYSGEGRRNCSEETFSGELVSETSRKDNEIFEPTTDEAHQEVSCNLWRCFSLNC